MMRQRPLSKAPEACWSLGGIGISCSTASAPGSTCKQALLDAKGLEIDYAGCTVEGCLEAIKDTKPI